MTEDVFNSGVTAGTQQDVMKKVIVLTEETVELLSREWCARDRRCSRWTRLRTEVPRGKLCKDTACISSSAALRGNGFLLGVKNGTRLGHGARHLSAGSPPGAGPGSLRDCLADWTQPSIFPLHRGRGWSQQNAEEGG